MKNGRGIVKKSEYIKNRFKHFSDRGRKKLWKKKD